MKVEIKNIINSSIAAFHKEGIKVFEYLEKAFKNKEQILVSFEGIEKCATQFLNASIGKMYMQYDPSELDKMIQYNYGTLDNLEYKIKEVRENAIDSKQYDLLVENATA